MVHLMSQLHSFQALLTSKWLMRRANQRGFEALVSQNDSRRDPITRIQGTPCCEMAHATGQASCFDRR